MVGWEKLNYLVGLAYPSGYESGRMVTPLIELTLGGLYVFYGRKAGILIRQQTYSRPHAPSEYAWAS